MGAVTDERVTAVRAFNRLYTGVIGVLGEGLLDTPYSLTEARVIFELAQQEATEVAELRKGIDLDAGYLSRILRRFEADGLVVRGRLAEDGRRQVIRLTEQGRATYALLDARAAASVRQLLGELDEERQRRLVAAMETVRALLQRRGQADAFVLRSLRPGDLGWAVQRHGALYAEEYGWDQRFEALVARIVADYVDFHDPQREQAWIAEVDGQPVGCVFCVRRDEGTAQLRLMLVEPRARGRGIGSRLVEECLRFAGHTGYKKIMLWTNDVLVDARRIYERAGFELVDEEAHHSFGQHLVGQHWTRLL